jgi:AAHS family cis,cis-muconate transporter-like MFS transporter
MRKEDSIGKSATWVAVAIFFALVVDGMDLQMLSLALPSIMKELNLSAVLGGSLATWTFFGMGVGGIFSGWMADRIGRVKVAFASIIVFSMGTCLIAFAHTYVQLATTRFVSGFGINSLYGVGTLLVSEYIETKRRATILGFIQTGMSIGYILAAIISSSIMPNFGWRPLFFMAIAPGFVSLLLLRGIKDPPSWFANREAIRKSGKRKNEFKVIFADKSIRFTFIAWAFTSIVLQFGFYGANTWLPSYLVTDLGINLKNMGWYMAATYTAMVLGKIVTGYLADIFGRRLVWCAVGLAISIALPVITWVGTPATIPYLLLIFGLLAGSHFGLLPTYTTESFPTKIRGTAVNTSYNIGRVGSTISPLMIGYAASRYSIGFGIALLGIAYVLVGIIPGIFIRQKMYDPKAIVVEKPAADLIMAKDQAG